MSKIEVRSIYAPAPAGAYSQAIRAGNLVFTAGTLPVSPETGKIVGDTVGEQTEQVLKNIKAILEEAGCKMDDVVKTTVHLADMDLFDEFNEVYTRYFPDPKPARTTVGSQLNQVLVEIDVIASLDD